MAHEEDDKLRKLADSSIMMLVSRLSVPIIAALCIWILQSVSSMQIELASALSQIQGVDTRITTLENWRNSFDAYAAEQPHQR